MSTPNPVPTPAPAPTAAQQVNTAMINSLLSMQDSLTREIAYLSNAAANLADRQARLAAVQTQLTALGYVAPTPST